MWVEISDHDGNDLIGSLDSDPVFVEGLEWGDTVMVKRVEILAVYLTRDEWMQEVEELWAEGNDILSYPPNTDGLEDAYEEGWTPRQALRWWNKRAASD